MEVSAARVTSLVLALLLVLTGNTCLLRFIHRKSSVDKTLTRIISYLIVSGLVSDTFSLVDMLISAISGGWPFDDTTCEVVGFVSTVLSASATWLVTIAAMERYFKLLIPSDHASTFSPRNLQIIVVGVFISFFMASTGPLYGFGQFTHLRGSLPVYVLVNTSDVQYATTDLNSNSSCVSNQQQQQHTSMTSKLDDQQAAYIISTVYSYLLSKYDVVISDAKWDMIGLQFIVRTPSSDVLDQLINGAREGSIFDQLPCIPCRDTTGPEMEVNTSCLALYMYVSAEDYIDYTDVYLPIQELGHCTTDLTSPNQLSKVWAVYFVAITFIIPFFILLTCLCAVYHRVATRGHLLTKDLSAMDAHVTNVLCTAFVLNCCVSLFYYTAILANMDGVNVHSDVMFTSTILFHSRSVILFLCISLTSSCCCPPCNLDKFLRRCGLYAKEALSYEMSEFDFSRTLTETSSTSRGMKSYPTPV